MAELRRHLLHHAHHGLVQRGQVAKARFPLCRMHVEVHQPGVDFHEQTGDRVAATGQQGGVAILHRLGQAELLNAAAVDKDHQPRPVAPGQFRPGTDDGDVKVCETALCLEQVGRRDPAAEGVGHALQWGGRRQRRVGSAVHGEAKRDLGMGQRLLEQHPPAEGGFGTGPAQETPPGRQVREQARHLDPGACGGRDPGHLAPPGTGHQPHRRRRGRGPADYLQPRTRGDAGQCLAAESQCGHPLQVALVDYLGGGMAQCHVVQIGTADAVAIVADGHQPESPGVQLHVDLAGPGIDRVVQQLAHDGEGAVNHFAGGNPAGHLPIEQTDGMELGGVVAGFHQRARTDARPTPGILEVIPFMVVSLLHLVIDLPGVGSLKEKRRAVGSLKDRIRNKYKVSVAEVGANELWHVAEIGCAVVSNSHTFGETVLHKIIAFAEENSAFPIRSAQVFSEHY